MLLHVQQQFCQKIIAIMDDETYLESKEACSPNAIIQSIKQTSSNIEYQRSIQKIQQQKYRKLLSKIHSLEAFQKKSSRESTILKTKKNKIQQNQTFAVWLLKNKIQNDKYQQKQQQNRRQYCNNQKVQAIKSLQKSYTFYQHRKQIIVNGIREQMLQFKQQHARKLSQSQNQLKKQKQKIKQQEKQIRQRLKRYEEFKLQVARQNYTQKLKKEIQVQKNKEKLLQQLKSRASQEEKIFRKTRILDKEVDSVNQIYITSHH